MTAAAGALGTIAFADSAFEAAAFAGSAFAGSAFAGVGSAGMARFAAARRREDARGRDGLDSFGPTAVASGALMHICGDAAGAASGAGPEPVRGAGP